MGGAFSALHWLAVSLWVGAMAGFGLLTAPVLFAVIPSRQMAGDVAGQVVWRIDQLGFVCGAVALATLLVAGARRGWSRIGWLRPAILAVMLAIAVASSTLVRSGLEAAQARMSRPIEQYAPTDPLRVEYNRWHRISVRIYSASFLLGVFYIAIGTWRRDV